MSLVVVAMVLFSIWIVSLITFDAGDIVHCFLIGSVIMIVIRVMFYKKTV